MNQVEDRTPLAGRLMMGPDGAVYALSPGTLQAPPSRKTGEGGAHFVLSAEALRRDSGDVPVCFKYSADVPRRDHGDIPICFAY
jgi:hypothetical protein